MDSENSSNSGRSAGEKIFKAILFIINVFTWIAGGALIGLAIWIVSSENDYKHFMQNQNFFIVYITLAAVLFTAGILGTCGVLLGNKILLKCYFFFICLVFCALFGIVIFGVVERSRLDTLIRDSWNSTSDDIRIFIQEKFDCCDIGNNNTGTKSYKDDSCYVNATTKYEVKQNCLSKLMEWFEDHQINIAVGGGAVMMVLILLMVGSCWLISRLNKSSINLNQVRVAPAPSNNVTVITSNNNDVTPYYEDPKNMNEMAVIEEPSDDGYSNVRRKAEAKTAKKQRSNQRNAWAKKSSNSPLVD